MDDDFYSLCHNLNISPDELTKAFSVWRFDTLHVRGVENLNTQEVFDYFGKEPSSIEWLSNISCNVTFQDWQTAVNSLLNMANGLVMHQNEGKLEDTDNLGLEVYTSETLEIPVPPNYRYFLGTEHSKAKAIIIRFATINDVKPAQVAVQRVPSPAAVAIAARAAARRKPARVAESERQRPSRLLERRSRERNFMRMRMRADDEEEQTKSKLKAKRRLISPSNGSSRSIWDRVGTNAHAGQTSGRLGELREDDDDYRYSDIQRRLGTRDDQLEQDRVDRVQNRRWQVNKAKHDIWRPTSSVSSVAHSKRGDLRSVISSKRENTLRIQIQYGD